MLKWPACHLSALARRVQNDWSRIAPLLALPESVEVLERLHVSLLTASTAQTNWLGNDKSSLRQFLDSAARFNRNWSAYIDGVDLEPVNKPRRDFNQF
jgi:hypothetical protein